MQAGRTGQNARGRGRAATGEHALLARRGSGCEAVEVSGDSVVIGTALAATGFFALSTALKHRSAESAKQDQATRGFLRATAAHPAYLTAIVADAVGLGLQITALHLGALAVVQPLMVTSLLFALILNHRFSGTRITGPELAGGAVLVLALAGFLWVSGASSPAITGPPQAADREPAFVIGVIAVVAGIASFVVARRSSHALGAPLIGATVGLIYACTAALIKATSNTLVDRGVAAALLTWTPYAAVASGAAGLVLAQLAFRTGPLRGSLPTIATVDLLMSIVLGVLVYGERLRPGVPAVIGEVACLTALCAAAVFLSRLAGDELDHAAEHAEPDAAVR